MELSLGICQRRLSSGQPGGARLGRLCRGLPASQLGVSLVERLCCSLQRRLLLHQLPLLGRHGRQVLFGLQQAYSAC